MHDSDPHVLWKVAPNRLAFSLVTVLNHLPTALAHQMLLFPFIESYVVQEGKVRDQPLLYDVHSHDFESGFTSLLLSASIADTNGGRKEPFESLLPERCQ